MNTNKKLTLFIVTIIVTLITVVSLIPIWIDIWVEDVQLSKVYTEGFLLGIIVSIIWAWVIYYWWKE